MEMSHTCYGVGRDIHQIWSFSPFEQNAPKKRGKKHCNDTADFDGCSE
jgi:hypothetical protein